jgi:hypothetical protein
LPSSDLLTKRRDRIIGYWEQIRTLEESLFKKEAETLLVLPKIIGKMRYLDNLLLQLK